MTSPADVRSQVQTLLNAPNPGLGRQAAMLTALSTAAQAISNAGLVLPPSLGSERYSDYSAIQVASRNAVALGEDGSYVGMHDGMVYNPAQMVGTLHRYLLALGWTTTGTQPAAPGSGDAAPIWRPATWRAALDQNGLTGTHTPLTGLDWVNPAKLPVPGVIDLTDFRIPGGRGGQALAANVPAGATRAEVQGTPVLAAGTSYWFGFSFQLSRSFPIEQNYFHTIARLRQPDNSQAIGLTIWQNQLHICGRTADGFTHTWEIPIGTVQRQTWHDVMFKVNMSTNPALGYISAYFDGQIAVENRFVGVQTFPSSGVPVLRYGLHRDYRCPGEACVYHAGWAMGSSMGSVMLPGSG